MYCICFSDFGTVFPSSFNILLLSKIWYSVRLTAVCFSLSLSADLTIEFEEMDPFTVMSEETLEVPITIVGFPPPNVTWSLNGVTIANNTRQIVSSAGITTSPVKPDDAGTYTVIAENGFSSATVTFELIVICKLYCQNPLNIYCFIFTQTHTQLHQSS